MHHACTELSLIGRSRVESHIMIYVACVTENYICGSDSPNVKKRIMHVRRQAVNWKQCSLSATSVLVKTASFFFVSQDSDNIQLPNY